MDSTAHSPSRTVYLHWWASAVAVVALFAPLPDGWNGVLQLAAVVLAVVALCVARDRATRAIAAAVIVVVGAVICVQVTSHIAGAQLDRTFSDDAVLID